MDYKAITTEYYSHWVGANIADAADGVEYVYSDERNRVQAGYGRRFDLWVWIEDKKIIVSYGDKAKDNLGLLRKKVGFTTDVRELIHILTEIYGGKLSHGVKYLFRGGAYVPGPGRILRGVDYELFEDFFRKNNPGQRDVSWLREYFDEMVSEGVCCGVVTDGMLTCCTDAPLMPYMAGEAQEIGVNTLESYRGRHYAADSARLCAEQIIKNGKCPQWSTDIDNIASQKTAESAGFCRFGEYIGITIED